MILSDVTSSSLCPTLTSITYSKPAKWFYKSLFFLSWIFSGGKVYSTSWSTGMSILYITSCEFEPAFSQVVDKAEKEASVRSAYATS